MKKEDIKPIAPALRATDYKAPHCVYIPTIAAMRGRYNDEGKVEQQLEINDSGSSNTLTSVQKDNLVCSGLRIRKLTPRECYRLMGVDDADIDKIQAAGISNAQQYKMAGNSIVVDVLYYLFKQMFVESSEHSKGQQLQLF